MRKTTALFVLVSIVCAMTAGCLPNADNGPVAIAPRYYPYLPSVQLTPATTQPSDPADSYVQR
jgi:hypothetical protein